MRCDEIISEGVGDEQNGTKMSNSMAAIHSKTSGRMVAVVTEKRALLQHNCC